MAHPTLGTGIAAEKRRIVHEGGIGEGTGCPEAALFIGAKTQNRVEDHDGLGSDAGGVRRGKRVEETESEFCGTTLTCLGVDLEEGAEGIGKWGFPGLDGGAMEGAQAAEPGLV